MGIQLQIGHLKLFSGTRLLFRQSSIFRLKVIFSNLYGVSFGVYIDFKTAYDLVSFMACSCNFLASGGDHLDFPYAVAAFQRYFTTGDVSFAHNLKAVARCYVPGKTCVRILRELDGKRSPQHVILSPNSLLTNQSFPVPLNTFFAIFKRISV